jgi:hypothetical protein
MDAVEFELGRAELSERITRPDRTSEIQGEIDDLNHARGSTGLVARFMINDQFMDQLKERAQQLADGTVAPPVDLAAGEQAENCDKGCAVK